MTQRHIVTAFAMMTAPGAAWLIGPWCAQPEVRRRWRDGRRQAAVELALGAAVAPAFILLVILTMEGLWAYALLSSAFHLWFLPRQGQAAMAAMMPGLLPAVPAPTDASQGKPVEAVASVKAPAVIAGLRDLPPRGDHALSPAFKAPAEQHAA